MHVVRIIWIGLAASLLLGALPQAFAAGSLDGEFEIRSAYIVFDHGVAQLNAQVQYPLSQQVRDALADGVTLDFDLDVLINQPRRFWFDATLVDLHLQRELSYHAVSGRYVLRNSNDSEDDDATAGGQGDPGGQESFATVEAALARLSRIDHVPVTVTSQLPGDGPWKVSVRADIRRGRLPGALRALVFWSDDWYRASDWYTWTLNR